MNVLPPINEYYKKYYKSLRFNIFGIIKNDEDVMTLIHNVFINVEKNRENYNSTFKPSTWIYNIAKNELVDYLRDINAKNTVKINYLENIPENSKIDFKPDKHLIKEDNINICKEIMTLSLTDNEKLHCTLFYLKEMSCVEISKILNVSTSYIRSNLHYIRKKLKIKYIELYGYQII